MGGEKLCSMEVKTFSGGDFVGEETSRASSPSV